MPTGIICVSSGLIEAGLAGDCRSKCSLNCDFGENDEFEEHRLYKPLATAIKALLVSPASLDIVVIEPPLFPLPWKKSLAKIILGNLRARSIAFLHLSVCVVVSRGLASGLVAYACSSNETAIVPVFDYRELTTLIETTLEQSAEEAKARIFSRCGLDICGILRNRALIVNFNIGDAYLGASVITSGSKVRPQLSRSEFLSGRAVYDSLFHDLADRAI